MTRYGQVNPMTHAQRTMNAERVDCSSEAVVVTISAVIVVGAIMGGPVRGG